MIYEYSDCTFLKSKKKNMKLNSVNYLSLSTFLKRVFTVTTVKSFPLRTTHLMAKST